jgi:hypothetical protein
MKDLFATEELVGHRRTRYVSSRHWLLRIASAVVILNLVDAIFTLVYVNGNVAVESNPLMKVALATSPVAFMITKLSLVSLCVFLLWRFGHRRSAMVGLVGSTVMYVILIGYHLSAVPMLMARL